MQPVFNSFWMGGFEGADHVNGSGLPLDPNAANGHDRHYDDDYAAAAQLGIRTVRESIGWRLFDRAGDTAATARLVDQALAARRHGVQVIWTLLHYGWPPHLDLLEPAFADAFAAHAQRIARALQTVPGPLPPVFQPVNEISFLAWAASATGLIHPHLPSTVEHGFAVKQALVRAALRACDAIRAVEPRARFLHTDPLVHVATPLHADADTAAAARRAHEEQFQAWDMLAGRQCPELGGAPHYLDILGLNYYHSGQWEYASNQGLQWHTADPRRRPFVELAAGAWRRYGRPLLVAETGHVGEGRALWLDQMAEAALQCARWGIPLEGICLYPLLDRPDWEDPARWHASGLWDLPGAARGDTTRVLHAPYARALSRWQSVLPRPSASFSSHSPGTAMTTLIVFSHLRWDFVFQRPQQLLSRLAAHHRVVFVEEPIPGAPAASLERTSVAPGVEVLRPHVTGAAHGFHDEHLATLQRLVGAYVRDEGIDDYLVWFYTPMAFPLAAELSPRAVVYDCMDELTAFHNAPRQLVQRENALFKAADVVFTGGPSLYQAKRDRHPNVHCFPSSVDSAHFGRAATDHPAQAALPHPRLGYFGVIDERLDIGLVATLADAHPEWQVVMVGPVVKIDPHGLPQRPNLHWLGQRTYAELPDLVAGWDVCLMPFALNDATRFISPTKTLEYLAAGRPVVSTPIRDVVDGYAGLVPVAPAGPEFVAACEAVLARDDAQRSAFAEAAAAKVAATSWDRTAEAMDALLRPFDRPLGGSAPVSAPASAHRAQPAANDLPVPHVPTLILGAGPTGLSAALELGADSLLLERQSTVGGWCRSIEDRGFTFDYAGHIMFSNDPFVLELYQRLLGDNMHWQNREAWVYSNAVYTRYPFQGALYGLPPAVLKDCLVGAIEARFGPLKKPALKVAAADGGSGAAQPAVPQQGSAPPKNFEEFIYRVWGAGVAKHFAIPYNRKLWAVPLDEMETSWLGGRVPMPDLEEMIEGALEPVAKPMGPNARFGYPLRGGFQALMDGFLPLLESGLELDATVVAVSPERHEVTLADGRRFRYDTLVSTLPLPKLVEAMGDEAPQSVKDAAASLRHVSVRCVNLGIGREAITEKHWIYYPEDTVFHRIFVQGNASPHCNPPGGFGLTCEITYSEYKQLPVDGDALVQRCIDDCRRVGIIREDDTVIASNQVDMPYAYVVYDHGRAAHVEHIRAWAAAAGILLAGRYSEWEYYNSDHAFVAGRKIAEAARARNAALSATRADGTVGTAGGGRVQPSLA